MNRYSLCTLAAILALLQTARAGDDFRITIIKGDAEPKLSKEQVEQFTKAGVAAPDQLPIVVCPLGAHDKSQTDPSSTFQVVIENTREAETKVTMLTADWDMCLSFKLVDDNGNSYSIKMFPRNYANNGPEERKWAATGKEVFPVSFFENTRGGVWDPAWNHWKDAWVPVWNSQKGSGEHAKQEWPAPKHPVIAHLTAAFRYYLDGKSIEVSSKATDVILMAK